MCKEMLALLLALLLGACGTTAATVTCPPLIKYGERTQTKAAQELEQMGDQFPTVRRFVGDYGKTRTAVRRCRTSREF